MNPGIRYLPAASILLPPDFIAPSIIFDMVPASTFREPPSSVPAEVTMRAFSIMIPFLCGMMIGDPLLHRVCFVRYGIKNDAVMEYAYHGSSLIFKLLKQIYNNSHRSHVQGR